MKGIFALIAGLGAGAAVMYLLDPDRGNRRRALIRDKMVKLNRQTQESVSGKAKDFANRAKGMLHEAKSAFEPPETETQQQQQPSTF
jgi:hypothetical protein